MTTTPNVATTSGGDTPRDFHATRPVSVQTISTASAGTIGSRKRGPHGDPPAGTKALLNDTATQKTRRNVPVIARSWRISRGAARGEARKISNSAGGKPSKSENGVIHAQTRSMTIV